ncbi:hypothetical protein C8J56DRAFT_1167210 [Mycena floridula]|nr:hypothetical protein C8J56DRAFT_1167210 [Mycena floridula]
MHARKRVVTTKMSTDVRVTDIIAHSVGGSIGSYINSTNVNIHMEDPIPRAVSNEPVDIVFSCIMDAISHPTAYSLETFPRASAYRVVLELPDFPVIEEIQDSKRTVLALRDSDAVNDASWNTLARLFGRLSSKFADMGWLARALRMSYYELVIQTGLSNDQCVSTSAGLAPGTAVPSVDLLETTARASHHCSLYMANSYRFNDARRASKEAISAQAKLCVHVPTNAQFKLDLSKMEKHLATFKSQDAAYNVIVCRSVGNRVEYPPDVTKLDIFRGALRQGVEVGSTMFAIIGLISFGWLPAAAIFGAGKCIGASLSSMNRRS